MVCTRLIGRFSRESAEPVVASLLIAVSLFVIFRPKFGAEGAGREARASVSWVDGLKLSIAAFAVGVHDDSFGPGAGIFFIFALIHLGKAEFLRATSTAKVIKLVTSAIALATRLVMVS